MKKTILLLLVCIICIVFTACKKDDTAVEITTNQPVATEKANGNTKPNSNKQKGDELKKTLVNHLDSAKINGELEYGKFTYSYNREPAEMYCYEHDEMHEALAKDNAEQLVSSISYFYEDEIVLYQFDAVPMGGGDNGFDSVRYEFCYTDSQNQRLTIYADSDGLISYVNCEITWY